MKLRFSRITKGFALMGFLIALFYVLLAVVKGVSSNKVSLFIAYHFSSGIMLILCPPSIAWIPFVNDASLADAISLDAIIILLNTLFYGAIGLVISQIHQLSKKLMKPKTA